METIKRPTRTACGCMAAGQSMWARVWTAAYRPMLYVRSVCDTRAPLQLQLHVICLCL